MPAVHLRGQFNITFVHVPKAAGSSIGFWMKERKGDSRVIDWWDHPTLATINKSLEDNFAFTVVRNPWDRMVSFYHFVNNVESLTPTHTSEQLQQYVNEANKHLDWSTFDKWLDVAHEFSMIPGWWFNPATPQTAWANGCDVVLKYENLEEDFKQIQATLNNWDPLPKLLVTKHDAYQHYYNDATRAKVKSMFEEEIDRWGYTF